jgi:hypothetical protein
MSDPIRIDGDPAVVVHVENAGDPCRSCGSANVMTVRMSHEDSPIWVQICSNCEERVWSLDSE